MFRPMRFCTLFVVGSAGFAAAAILVACASLDGLVGADGGADATTATVLDASGDVGADGNELPQSTPGSVACGRTPCAIASSECCFSAPATPGGPPTTTCQPSTETCTTYAISCDEKADCPNGEYCCFGLGDAGEHRASCSRTCVTLQSCRTNEECLGGKPCKQQTCFGQRVWVCAPSALCSAN
jgi:hypothetical protein